MLDVKDPQDASVSASELFGSLEKSGHEQVVFCYDEASGLKSIIAIHDTTLGPALGGTRMWNYSHESEALNDVLRLSRGMTYKAAISGINLGGGKAVIIGDSYTQKSEALWRRYGKFVNSLNGKYITAEDVGTSTQDMEYISMQTEHVTGVPFYMGGSGDPSPVTAYGTYLGMKASAKKAWGTDSLEGKTVMVQGTGHVGEFLCEHLKEEGAKILVSDINEDRVNEVASKFGASVIGIDDVYGVDMDIYAPCALGATLDDVTIPQLKCQIIAGAANNQLKDEIVHGNMVKDKGLLYAPDFLINAGGLINVYMELVGYNKERSYGTTDKIYDRTLEIYKKAEDENITTHSAAVAIAKQRIKDIAALNSKG